MLQITRQQTLRRWNVLPQNLRESLFSEYNSNILWRICEEQHLSEDKISKIATLAGDVIMGFIHPEDLDDEIKKTLGINQEIAAFIARQIDRKIFSLIKNDINKVYAPAGTLAEEKLAEESALSSEISEEHIVDLREKAEAEKPQIISLDTLKTEIKTEIEKPKEEIKKEPSITQLPITQLPSEAPFILHKQEEMKPVLGAKKSLGGLFGFLGKEEMKEEMKAPKPVAVEIQIGGIEPPAKSRVEPPKPQTPIELAKPRIELPKPSRLAEKMKIEERSGFFKKMADFFKSLFIKKEIEYKEVEIPASIEVLKPPAPSQPASSSGTLPIPLELVKFQAIQQKKAEIVQPPKSPAPTRIVHYTDLRTPLETPKPPEIPKPPLPIKTSIAPISNEPVVSGEFIKIEHPPKYQPKEEIIVDLRKAVEPKIEPKVELKIELKKEKGEMIDLSEMKKINE